MDLVQVHVISINCLWCANKKYKLNFVQSLAKDTRLFAILTLQSKILWHVCLMKSPVFLFFPVKHVSVLYFTCCFVILINLANLNPDPDSLPGITVLPFLYRSQMKTGWPGTAQVQLITWIMFQLLQCSAAIKWHLCVTTLLILYSELVII